MKTHHVCCKKVGNLDALSSSIERTHHCGLLAKFHRLLETAYLLTVALAEEKIVGCKTDNTLERLKRGYEHSKRNFLDECRQHHITLSNHEGELNEIRLSNFFTRHLRR